MDTIINNLSYIHQKIDAACIKAGRPQGDVRLLMATKTVDPTKIKVAINAGETLLGENKVQEMRDKDEALKDHLVERHFIGHLQTNKVKDIIRYATCIESVDRESVAEKLSKELAKKGATIDVLIQVNTSFEESKFGVAPSEALNLVRSVAKYDNIKIKGLMTIGLFSADKEKVRKCFKLLKQIQQEVMAADIPHVEMKELSMGMSGDYEVAIEEGATIVRIGTAIFGARIYPDSFYWDESK